MTCSLKVQWFWQCIGTVVTSSGDITSTMTKIACCSDSINRQCHPYLKEFTTFTREGDRDRVRRKHTGASHCLNLNSIIVLPVSSSMPLLTFKSGAIIIIATDSLLDYVTRKMSGRRRRQRLAGRRSGSQVELDFMARGHLWSFGPQDPIRTVLSLV